MKRDKAQAGTLFLYLKSITIFAAIPFIIVSSAFKHNFKNLMEIDPDLVFLDKTLIVENLITEIKAKIG